MSAITDYFAAATDEAAAGVLDDPAGTRFVPAKRIDPTVSLGRLEEVLTGRPYDEIVAGPLRGSLVSMSEDGDVLVLTVSDDLRDALARSGPDDVLAAARTWVFDEAAEPSEEIAPFVAALAELAVEAVAGSGRLYCRVVI